MLKRIKNKLYDKKVQLLVSVGINNGTILPIEDDFYDRLSTIYYNGLPMSIRIKYFKPILPPGKCYERSLYMVTGFDDAILVRGNTKVLALAHGEEEAGHGWIEHDGWVYDPTILLKFRKDMYYKIYEPYNVKEYKPEEYKNSLLYQEIVNTTLDDYKPHGRKRIDLLVTMLPIEESVVMLNNPNLTKELNQFLTAIDYDYGEIVEEFNDVFQKKKAT